MEKLKMESVDMTQKNVEKIESLFPNVVTEMRDDHGKIKICINFELLKQELSNTVVDGEECYDFTWVGKKAAIVEGNTPIRKTLRPCIEESKDWETTGNLYLEGDNLDVLKLLQESYLNSIKMIYIDPPYNSGKDSFIYNDDFTMDRDEYEDEIKYRDEEGNIHFKQNNLTNPRYHSDWCSMLYSRLKLVYNLLREDGVIFISIDDNEVDNLKKLCNEIFGETNFEGHIHWRRRHNQPNDKTKMIGLVAEHIICYAKCSSVLKKNGVGKIDLTGDFSNPDNDPLGEWASKPWKVGSDQSGSRYTIMTPTGKVLDEEWMGEKKTYQELLSHGRIFFPKGGDGMPRKKYYRFEREEEGQCATNWWSHDLFGHNQGANDCLTGLFGRKNVFSNPKPVELIRGLLQIANVKFNDYILDFFSGSATCAHAVIQLNAEDDEYRKFIMVQYPEDLDESLQKADNSAKKTIQNAIEFCDEIGSKHLLTEIGKERIRRAGEKIKEDNKSKENINNLDIGFRVLKVDNSNMKDVYYAANEYRQSILAGLESNIKEDRSDLDLLYGVLLDWGLPLSLNHKIEEIDGVTVHTVDEGSLVACFEERITENVVREIAKRQSLRVVFRDSSFANSPDKINVEEIFKLLAPNTAVKVI